MKFTEAIKTCYSKSFTCSGRASRSELWYLALFNTLGMVAIIAIAMLFSTLTSDQYGRPNGIVMDIIAICGGLLYFASLPAAFCCQIRRLHDVGKSGWYYLWILVPYVGGLIILYWSVQPGDKEENKYGLNPLLKENKHYEENVYKEATSPVPESAQEEPVLKPKRTAMQQPCPTQPTVTESLAPQKDTQAATNLPPELPMKSTDPPSIPGVSYYAAINGQQVGPLYIQQVMKMIGEGTITPNTLLWRAGMTDWALAESFNELGAAFNAN